MNKEQLIKCIRICIFATEAKRVDPMTQELGQYFVYYFAGLDALPDDIENYLPELIHNAIALLKSSTDNVTNYFRISFEKIIEDSWPEIINISSNKNSSIIRNA